MGLLLEKKAIEAGSSLAKSNYGIELLFGDEKDRDVEKGFRLCHEAAVEGEEMAIDAIGRCYKEGIVVRKNQKKAFQCYLEAVEYGAGAYAELHLSRCYRKGVGVAKNAELAQVWYKRTLEHGYVPNKKKED